MKMSILKNKDQLKNRIVEISRLIGRPAVFYIGVKGNDVKILNIDANFEYENEYEASTIYGKKEKINFLSYLG